MLATGSVTTLAGTAGLKGNKDGTGAAAQFRAPYGVAVDGAGNLYVTDVDDCTVRKVVLATGAVTTIAGTAGMPDRTNGIGAAARFYGPEAVVADGAGNLYVADTFNFTIRKIVLATGAVTTFAGTAGLNGSTDGIGTAARFYEPTGSALDDGGTLYVADTLNRTLRKIILATGSVTTVAGSPGMTGSADGVGAAARFYSDVNASVAVDKKGNLYFADAFNHALRKVVLATGSVTTYAGGGSLFGVQLGPLPSRLNQPLGVTVLPTGEIIFSDENSILAIR